MVDLRINCIHYIVKYLLLVLSCFSVSNDEGILVGARANRNDRTSREGTQSEFMFSALLTRMITGSLTDSTIQKGTAKAWFSLAASA